MDDDIEARLESHAEAFEGLLSLIPAADYYGRDNSDQWQRKKQTKEEKKAARKAKLDPANHKSAMDVINENEKKRKRELGVDSEELPATDIPDSKPNKKVKTDGLAAKAINQDGSGKTMAEKRKEKRERQKERVEKQKQKSEAKKARKEEKKLEEANPAEETRQGEEEDWESIGGDGEVEAMDMSGLAADDTASTAPSTPGRESPQFDTSANNSTTSSSTSIIPPAEIPKTSNAMTTPQDAQTSKPKKQKAFNLPKIDPEELQARLKARIEELRLRRKADGPDGRPPQSRQDLLESRRKKSEARKAHKKELRQKAKAEEDRLNQERLQGSGSPMSADIFSPGSPMQQDNYFTFGRVAFEDGALADTNTGEAKELKQRRGPKDPKQQLELAKKREDRLKGFDETKRKDIEEKDRWLAARKKVHGERVRDDSSLLKKALKRKEKAKSKSEKEWKDREEGVKKGKEMRQKKREDNLAKRKEEKGGKGKMKGKPKGKPKKKGRPGFEGK
ncbi:SURF6-domain-containing protein [Myriangium duriaei CBS 260.36]|uniref:SURF6-domain-containing protein n=1 Tax=Myriangium duriaei CBS 260.36 TaxID=1168546 RepID=A0A9P4J3B6_9PEZI|nr:SURF6-domain-containing protein [Myriangium duriaei CBS 260.36]